METGIFCELIKKNFFCLLDTDFNCKQTLLSDVGKYIRNIYYDSGYKTFIIWVSACPSIWIVLLSCLPGYI